MKLMAIDYGEKRVGIASTDDSGEFALPRAVYTNDSELLEKIVNYAREEKITKIILGDSRNLKGEPNSIMGKVNFLKTKLEAAGLEVTFHPEVLTTREARLIQGNTAMIDASAAALILKSYLESKGSS